MCHIKQCALWSSIMLHGLTKLRSNVHVGTGDVRALFPMNYKISSNCPGIREKAGCVGHYEIRRRITQGDIGPR